MADAYVIWYELLVARARCRPEAGDTPTWK